MKTFLKVWLSISLVAIGLGIGLLILAVASGTTWKRSIETYSFQQSYEGIENIDFEIAIGKVDIVEGDTFSIDAARIPEGGLESFVEDGTWYLRENKDYNVLNIFGIKFNAKQIIRWDENLTPRITITLPDDFSADDFILDVGAGYVTVKEIDAVSGYFAVDAGRLTIDKLTLLEESQYSIGAGEMVLQNMTAKNTSIDCGVGTVVIEGTLTGNNDISCSLGKIDLTLYGDMDDYDCEVNSGIGNVVIDGFSYLNVDHKSINNNAAENSLNLDCGVGSISVDFR